jgi:signal peptidase I
MKAFFRDAVIIVAVAAVIVAGQRAIIPKIVVVGPSMNSTLHDGQQIIVNRLVYRFHKPERGDIIVFYPPNNGKEEYIKRIIGLPGESVEMRDGVVYIHKEDGSILPLYEPYVAEPSPEYFLGDVIPQDEYFVIGDNRNNSNDSRRGWTVPFANILGKAWLSVWPLSSWGLVANYPEAKKGSDFPNSE